jgi:replicative DNA helicase
VIARIPPQSVDSEVAVLGGLMLDPNALAKVRLTAADFYRRDHAMIYRAICELASDGKPYDAVTLGDWFDARGESRLVQGGAYLIDLASTTPSAANIRAYAAIVRDKAMMRRAIDIGSALVNASFEPNGVDSVSVLDTAIRELMALTKDDQSCEFTLKQAMALAWADVEAAASSGLKVRGVPTGYARMDARLGGWHNGDLAFIGARPSMGKTAIMVNLALNAAAAGHSVGIISGEQSAMQPAVNRSSR